MPFGTQPARAVVSRINAAVVRIRSASTATVPFSKIERWSLLVARFIRLHQLGRPHGVGLDKDSSWEEEISD